MAKVAEDAAAELSLGDERKEVKKNRHVSIAASHLKKRSDALTKKINELTAERDGCDAAIKSLE